MLEELHLADLMGRLVASFHDVSIEVVFLHARRPSDFEIGGAVESESTIGRNMG